jgi:hypothetical protein
VGLQYVDSLGELTSSPGAAAELAEDAAGLELAFARSPGTRSQAWAPSASFWKFGVFFP